MVTKNTNNNDASYELFRELLDSKFENLEQKIDSNHKLQTEISTNILTQAQKTNGRVTKLETKVLDLEIKDKEHVINCPLKERVNVLEGEVITVKTIRKIIIQGFGILGIIGALVFGIYEIIQKL